MHADMHAYTGGQENCQSDIQTGFWIEGRGVTALIGKQMGADIERQRRQRQEEEGRERDNKTVTQKNVDESIVYRVYSRDR